MTTKNTGLIYHSNIPDLVTKITALWAFSESGLGGILHAVRLPFSGIFLGSISVILITFLAYNSQNKWKTIIQAMLLVIMLKVLISPHSPVMAYAAVAFQGVLGAAIYSVFGVNKVSTVCFGMIALFESAFQKILTLTIIFGVQLWEAISNFFGELTQRFELALFEDLPWIVLISYGLLYVLVGITAGIFAYKLPKNIQKEAQILRQKDFMRVDVETVSLVKRKRLKKVFLFSGIGLFIVIALFFTENEKTIGYVLLRTLTVLLVFLFVISPLVKFLLRIWVSNRRTTVESSLTTIISEMPQLRKNTIIANSFSNHIKNPITRAKRFLIYWITISLYFEPS